MAKFKRILGGDLIVTIRRKINNLVNRANKLGIEVGTEDGQFMYWDGDNWSTISTDNIKYDDVNKRFRLNNEIYLYHDGTEGYIETNIQNPSDLAINCGTNKTLFLSETVWDDINLGAAQLSRPTSSQPDLVNFVDNTGTDTGIQTYGFADGEKIHGGFELIHTYKEGTNLKPHIHFQVIDAPSGTDYIRWRLKYTIAKKNNTLSPTSTIEGECAVDTQYSNYLCNLPEISGTNLEIGDQLLFTLERITANGDAFAGDALIQTFGVHHQVDTLGSRKVIGIP